MGDRLQARAYYDQALDLCQRIRYRPEIALIHLDLAELLLNEAADADAEARPPLPVGEGRGEATAEALRAEARAHLDFSIPEFQAMNMPPALERAVRLTGLLRA